MGLEPDVGSRANLRPKVLAEDGTAREFALIDYALDLWHLQTGRMAGLPAAFGTAGELAAGVHLDMQAALQPFVGNSISKTINVPQYYPFEEFKHIYDLAHDLDLKGCTAFRPNPVTGMVLCDEEAGTKAPHCCVIEREAD